MKKILRPRSRLLSFRMTGEEYEQLRTVSIARGARCLSEFARSVLLDAMQSPAQEPCSATGACHVERRIAAIEVGIAALTEHLSPGGKSEGASNDA